MVINLSIYYKLIFAPLFDRADFSSSLPKRRVKIFKVFKASVKIEADICIPALIFTEEIKKINRVYNKNLN